MEKSKYLGGNGKKNYFEGWYFKQVSADGEELLSLIPGISFDSKDPHCFIQVVQNKKKKAHYIRYNIEEFAYKESEFAVRIGNSFFGEKGIHLDIDEKELQLKGDLTFSKFQRPRKTVYAPTIMGPFSYLKSMECNHEIVSLYHEINGTLKQGKKNLKFDGGTGYIEKDFGTSFPKEYLWLESHHPTSGKQGTFFLSIATIPLRLITFEGIIGVIATEGREWHFGSYYAGRKVRETKEGNFVELEVKQGRERLLVRFEVKKGLSLKSPKLGKMDGTILEEVDGNVEVILYSKGEKVLEETFLHTGIEYVRK